MIRSLSFLAAVLVYGVAAIFTPALAQDLVSTDRVSESSSGEGQDATVGRPIISPNGRIVAFASDASNLISDDTNSSFDIFTKSLISGVIGRVNLGPGGAEGNDDSVNPATSPQAPNGFIVIAFESDATNLARTRATFPDTNNRRDIFFSLPTFNDHTERISVGPNGVESNGTSNEASVTIVPEPNRMLIAYSSIATNLVSNDTNGNRDVFLATLTSPGADGIFDHATDIVTTRVSVAALSGDEPDGDSAAPQISSDGNFIVFESNATNLVSGVSPTTRQIYLYDVVNRSTILVSKSPAGVPGESNSSAASINYRGNLIIYVSASNNIVEDGFNPSSNTLQVMLYDRENDTTTRVNTSSSGTPGNGTTNSQLSAVVSANGRFALFSDSADNLVSGDSLDNSDIFLKDLSSGAIIRASTGSSGAEADGDSFFATVGQSSYNSLTALASYGSSAENLISNDTENNADVFVATLTIPEPELDENTTIDVPADIGSPANKKVSVTMQDFAPPAPALLGLGEQSRPRILPLLPGQSVQYSVDIHREDNNGKKREFERRITKKRSITFNRRKPGIHVVSYRVLTVRRKQDGDFRTIRKTNRSPLQRIRIGEG